MLLQQTLDELDNENRSRAYTDEAVCAEADQSTGDTQSRYDWVKEATNFAHTVYGFSLASETIHGTRLGKMAQEIIDRSPAN